MRALHSGAPVYIPELWLLVDQPRLAEHTPPLHQLSACMHIKRKQVLEKLETAILNKRTQPK